MVVDLAADAYIARIVSTEVALAETSARLFYFASAADVAVLAAGDCVEARAKNWISVGRR